MKVLVTGAAGFIGSHLCEGLNAQGHEVLGIDSLDPYYSPLFKRHTIRVLADQGIDIKVADLIDADLDGLLKKVDVVFHLAAQPGNSARIPFNNYLRNNIVATQTLLDAAMRSNSLQCFINAATSSVYGFYATSDEATAPKPVSVYGVTKLAAEQLVLAKQRDDNFPACSVRLFSVYGERERPDKLYPRLIRAITNDTEFTLFEGSEQHQRSFTYVSDIVDGLINTLNRFDMACGEIFNLGTDQSITTGEGIAIVEKLTGKKVRIKMLPKRPGDQLSTKADIAKARQLLNYQPKIQPQEGLERFVNWYQSKIQGKVHYGEEIRV